MEKRINKSCKIEAKNLLLQRSTDEKFLPAGIIFFFLTKSLFVKEIFSPPKLCLTFFQRLCFPS